MAKDFRENKNLTCRKCTTQSCQSLRTSYQETPNILLIQINRFSVSNLHGRPRKNNHPFGIYENIKLGLINYTLLGLIEHHGVFIVFIFIGHYVSYIRQSNKWYHCDDKHITVTNLLTLLNNVYLMLYAKEVDLECLASKNVLRMQGGHKPFSYVAVSFSPEHYLMCSRFCLVWTLLL